MAPSAVTQEAVANGGETLSVSTSAPTINGAAKQVPAEPQSPWCLEFQYPPVVPEQMEYSVLDQYHSKPTKLRVACVGAGASGLCLAYKMEKMMVPGSWELTLFEKNPELGGTWYENTYPGLACDVRNPEP
jgi:hypothetical protein